MSEVSRRKVGFRFPWRFGSLLWIDIGRWNIKVFTPRNIFVWGWNEPGYDCICYEWSFGMLLSIARFETWADDVPNEADEVECNG